MNEQLIRIKEKINQLKRLDRNNMLFGAQKHQYKINPAISIDAIRQFETTHNITLPNDYVGFLTTIGNGGAGPFYGLEPLQNTLYDDLDYQRKESLLDPGKPFLHTEPWNVAFLPSVDPDENEAEYEIELANFEEVYFDKNRMNGLLAICNYGCAVSLNFVVNGKEYGNIWTDDRASDNGIYPSRELGNTDKIGFLDWYELWLDNSINEIKTQPASQDTPHIADSIQIQVKKPWWKIW